MGYAHYTSVDQAAVKDEPGWYDELGNIRDEDIVGWAIWFNSGLKYCSLDVTATDMGQYGIIQTMLVWSFQSRDSEHIVCAHYTREVYPVPLSDVILKGGWTDMLNHDRITHEAGKESWPPSWTRTT